MTVSSTSVGNRILRRQITGARRLSNYWWAVVLSIGATGFLLAGLSSYFKVNLLPFANPITLAFIPQGVAMTFYGVAGLLLALYLWLIILWDVGGGYNEFNRDTNFVRIFRWGFPGKNRRIEFSCRVDDIQAVRIEIKEGLNPRRAIYLRVKERGNVPLTPVGQPMPLAKLEDQGAELARFLDVPVEGL